MRKLSIFSIHSMQLNDCVKQTKTRSQQDHNNLAIIKMTQLKGADECFKRLQFVKT